jgi:hypothetical protein
MIYMETNTGAALAVWQATVYLLVMLNSRVFIRLRGSLFFLTVHISMLGPFFSVRVLSGISIFVARMKQTRWPVTGEFSNIFHLDI